MITNEQVTDFLFLKTQEQVVFLKQFPQLSKILQTNIEKLNLSLQTLREVAIEYLGVSIMNEKLREEIKEEIIKNCFCVFDKIN